MAFEVGSIVARVEADLTGFNAGMKTATKAVQGVSGTVSSTRLKLENFTSSVFNLKNAFIGAGFGLFSKELVEAGVTYDRLEKTLGVVANNVGVTTDELKEMRDTLAETNTQGSDAAKTMLSFLQSGLKGEVDFKKFIGVTKDFAASVGVSSAAAIQDFTRSLTTLRPELLETYGIQFNLNKVYGDFAAEAGTKVANLTAEQKRMALLNEVYRQGANVQGVYAETYNTAGKNLLSIQDRLRELKEYIGSVFVPAFGIITNSLQGGLKNLVVWFQENKETVEQWANDLSWHISRVGDVFNAVIAAFQSGDLGLIRDMLNDGEDSQFTLFLEALTKSLMSFGSWVKNNSEFVINFIKGLGIALGTLLILATISALITAITNPLNILIFAIGLLYAAWQENFWGIRDITNSVVTSIIDFWQNYLEPALEKLRVIFQGVFGDIVLTLKGSFEMIVGILQVATDIIIGVIKIALAIFVGDWKLAWENVKQMTSSSWNHAKNVFEGAKNFMKGWGGAVHQMLVEPFRRAWEDIKELVNKIKDKMDFTHRESPSIIDILERGVQKANNALGELQWSTNITPPVAAAGIMNANSTTGINHVTVDLSGAFIGNEYEADSLGERVGDSIVRRLQQNVRF